MKTLKQILGTVFASVALIGSIQATEINLYVDVAPNAFGSPYFPAWLANAREQAAAGTFVNMANSVNIANVGTTEFEMADITVYSVGDLGRRLHFVYYVPGETIASLTAKNFQISLSYVWDGVTYDFYADNFGETWQTPGSWEEYGGGVFGSAGFAWVGSNIPAVREQQLMEWDPFQGDIIFGVRMDGAANSITATHSIPDGGLTVALLGAAVTALGAFRRRNP